MALPFDVLVDIFEDFGDLWYSELRACRNVCWTWRIAVDFSRRWQALKTIAGGAIATGLDPEEYACGCSECDTILNLCYLESEKYVNWWLSGTAVPPFHPGETTPELSLLQTLLGERKFVGASLLVRAVPHVLREKLHILAGNITQESIAWYGKNVEELDAKGFAKLLYHVLLTEENPKAADALWKASDGHFEWTAGQKIQLRLSFLMPRWAASAEWFASHFPQEEA